MAYKDADKARKNRREYQRRRRAEDPEYAERLRASVRRNNQRPEVQARRRAWQRNQRATPDGWAAQTIVNIGGKCRREGLPFDIEAGDLVTDGFCPVLGIAMVFGTARTDASPSVDRIRPEKGYVKGNVRVISWLANRIKQDCVDPRVFRAVADYVEGHI